MCTTTQPTRKQGEWITQTIRLVCEIASGAFGSLWLAEHASLATSVAVKFLHPDVSQDPEALARFSIEAAAASRVRSPHVIQVFDRGVTADGAPYIVMELLEGRDLGTHLEDNGPLPATQAVAMVAQVAKALARIHERGIVHRDIKPENVFLCEIGGGELFVKVVDFGLAKSSLSPLRGPTTRQNKVVGTPFYMSPEQLRGSRAIGPLVDLWALAIVAFEALTGRRPFEANDLGALSVLVHSPTRPLLSRFVPRLPRSVDAWFLRATALDPEERFPTPRELADALARALSIAPLTTPALGVPAIAVPPPATRRA